MRIIDIPLGADERPGDVGELEGVGNEAFLAAVVGGEFTVHHRSTASLLALPGERRAAGATGSGGTDTAGDGDGGEGEDEPTWSLLLRAVHQAFCAHLPLSLSPDVLWYAVVHEVAVHVRLNAEAYAGVFGSAPTTAADAAPGPVPGTRRPIVVRDDSLLGPDPDWSRSIRLVREPLAEAIGAELVDLFQPSFSTTTPDDVSSALVALMDAVSPYCDFQWLSLCGIPRVRLEGTAADWSLLAEQASGLARRFTLLDPWFAELLPVLDEIAATAAGGPVDEDFWRSLYKWESESGGPYVSGWITAFFAHTRWSTGPRPRTDFRWWGREHVFTENAFPSHVSQVRFEWRQPAGPRRMAFVAGVLGVERDGDYLRPRLGHAVLEVLREGGDPAAEQAALAAAQLPAGWTVERVRQVSRVDDAALLATEGLVVDDLRGDPEQARPVAVIRFTWACLFRVADDEDWYVGLLDPRRGVLGRENSVGPDLTSALERMHGY
ncbi:DUF4419 domain-containing protein [Kitasatospora sp. NPDC101176]|uniref:DUF4419 domain-containing protein n=1 Tax=Kitasatospora sp. NPDC101176 TaxID=3364099 RepID=UPI003809B751